MFSLRHITIRDLKFAFCILHFAMAAGATAQVVDDASFLAREEAALRAAADHVAESVVQIRTVGGLDRVDRTILADGPTTGLIVSPDGYIVSSAFNFVQQPASILVTFASGKQVPAELVATDHSRMIVLLKAAGVDDLHVAEAAPEGEIQVGQWAIAVGRTFHADRINVSVGIVSAVRRMFGKALQTDADVSAANYGGPLVDVRGRVLGVLVPMAPQATSQVAGVEWYDSGIGFAVPISSIQERIEQLKKGDHLRPGLLGVGLESKNPHAAPAVFAAVRPDSPAGKAGLRKGDRIVEIDGEPIETQTEMRFALGPRYGGDKVKIAVQRGKERIEREIELVGELPVFRHAFLGILPMRDVAEAPSNEKESQENEDANEKTAQVTEAADGDAESEKDESKDAVERQNDSGDQGILVRMVYSGSPAEAAGVRPGDRIMKINEAAVDSIDAALAELNNAAAGSEIALHVDRESKALELKVTAARLPTNVPAELPPAYRDTASTDGSDAKASTGETRELKLPEFPQQAHLYVPAGTGSNRSPGLFMWLHAPGDTDAKETIKQWKPLCDRYGLLLVLPSASDSERWEKTELEYLGRLMERVLMEYKIDSRRVVVGGHEGGGGMAWLLGFSGRQVFRGIAVSTAPVPRQTIIPASEPTQRLAVFAAVPSDKEVAPQTAMGLQRVGEAGYPVTAVATANNEGRLSEAEREQLARWIDTLDRF
jgi:serine protease Do